MEIKLVGWTTGSDKTELALAANVNKSDLSHFSYLCEKAIKEDIIKNKWKFSGEWHQNGKCGMPVISVDNVIGEYMLSWRAWGGLMAECWNEIEQDRKYDYIDFYMWPSSEESVHSNEEWNG